MGQHIQAVRRVALLDDDVAKTEPDGDEHPADQGPERFGHQEHEGDLVQDGQVLVGARARPGGQKRA